MELPANAMPPHIIDLNPTFKLYNNSVNKGRIALFLGSLCSGALLFLAFYMGKKYFKND